MKRESFFLGSGFLLAALVFTSDHWFAPFRDVLAAHVDALTGLQALLASLGLLFGAWWFFWRRMPEKKEAEAPEVVKVEAVSVERSGLHNHSRTVPSGNEFAHEENPERLLEAWLQRQTRDCQRLPLGIIDSQFVRDGGEQQIGLPEVYVDLDVTTPQRPEEGDDSREWSWRLVRGEAPGRRPILEALAEGQQHVLLGDPGSGKTTFAHYLCQASASHLLATARAEGSAESVAVGGIPEAFTGLLPVRFVLREVMARWKPGSNGEGAAEHLWAALKTDLARTLGDAGAGRLFPHLRNRLLEDGGLMIFDGLDEVPASHRENLLKAVRSFADLLAGGRSHILVTARPYAYAEHWRLEGFQILALAPFDEGQVRRFVEQWYQVAARRVFEWNEETARDRGHKLLEAIEGRPYLGDLGSRPLLLTLMATLHSSRGQLPEDRANLYEETVKLLLSRWQRAWEVKTADGELVAEQSIAQVLNVAEDRLRGALDHLAHTVHERQGAESQEGDEPADISQAELLVAFEPLLGELSPTSLLRYLADRAGVLVERREGVYAFPHRSFQEYLAASYLSSLPEPGEEIRKKAFGNPLWWREVVLLALGRGKFSGIGNAVSLLRELQNADPPPTEPDEAAWPVAVLCGLAILELRLLDAQKDRPHYGEVIERSRRWLVALVEQGRLEAKERLEAGEVLAELGDPRKGVGLLVGTKVPIPDIDWVKIPAGSFTMGSTVDDKLAWDWEQPAHSLYLEKYWVSRFPVTNAHFRPFVEGDGYTNPRYWREEGWAWRQGEEPEPDLSIYPEEYHEQVRQWFAKRPVEKRDRPFFWFDRRLSIANRPVVGLSWHEALAFTRWLEVQYRELDIAPVNETDLKGWQVRLPSEAEWEKAARGVEGSLWPWEGDFDAAHCNSAENELGLPSSVGIFPANRSPFGAVDTSGNVWEWTTTAWAEKSYPYNASDGREDLGGNRLRVLRGGSFYADKRYARCAARGRYIPDGFNDSGGFRLVLSPGEF